MLKVSRSNYICWTCLSSPAPRVLNPRRIRGNISYPRAALEPFPRGACRIRTHATLHDSTSASKAPGTTAVKPPGSIRERLREWETENPAPHELLLAMEPDPTAPLPAVAARVAGKDAMQFDEDLQEQSIIRGDGVVDLRADSSRLEAGDLIEVSSESWNIDMLAICLGTFNGLSHFYTHTGKWMTSSSIRTRFVVKHFITDASMLKPVLAELPPPHTSLEIIKILQDLKYGGPSRSAGAKLITSMLEFQAEARRIHQTHVTKLNKARSTLGGRQELLTLLEIAEKILPSAVKKMNQFSPQALYAVHMALRQEDVAFSPLASVGYGGSYFFRTIDEDDYALVQKVEGAVRRFYENPKRLEGPLRDQDLEEYQLGRFILKARKAIDNSRKARDWSTHGILGPCSRENTPILPGWTKEDQQFINFIDRWAVRHLFGRNSRLQWVGSAILRAMDRYQSAEYLTNSIGWVFLQEISWITPWEVPSRHHLRLPGVQLSRAGGIVPFEEDNTALVLRSDIFPQRTPTSATVFCIDSDATVDVDDGISLERTSSAGEYWVHVHVANPTSRLAHDTWPAARAALIPQTIYLPGHYYSMFQEDAIRDQFSLAPGRPSLTFSAKVNEEGTLLDYKIEATQLTDVVYMTPGEVTSITGDEGSPFPSSNDFFAVGQAPDAPQVPRKETTKAGDLSPTDTEDLHKLYHLAATLQGVRKANGAIPVHPPLPNVEVSLEHIQTSAIPGGFLHCTGDPYIRVSQSDTGGSTLVSSLMQLAGEVAARWCAARGIPIPYRVQDPGAQYKADLDDFTQSTFYPQLMAGRKPSPFHWQQLRALVGSPRLSSEPGPLYTMGLDMYAKVTSPLRRYGDLLAHWQIEAALLEEARRGESLVGNTADDFLPFKRAELDRHVLPHLKLRERHAQLLDRIDGRAAWILQALVRAWKFGEPVAGQPLPKTFLFTVSDIIASRKLIGRINWFDRDANIDVDGLGDAGLLSETRAGDVFEVELEHIDVYTKQINLKALRKVN